MANLVVCKFETADGAGQALELGKPLQSQYMLELFDAAVVSWPAGAKKPRTKPLPKFELISSNLSKEQEELLRQTFA